MPAKRALALDLGTTFGFACLEAQDTALLRLQTSVTYGSHKLTKKPKEPIGIRYYNFSTWLDNHAGGTGAIYYEDVKNHAGVLASHMYGGYLAILQMFAYMHSITLVPIGVGTVKKFATGRGNASKDEMIAAAEALGYSPQDDNAADAIHILRCGLAQENSNA